MTLKNVVFAVSYQSVAKARSYDIFDAGAGFSKAANTLIVKSINVAPAGAAGTMPLGMTPEGGVPPLRMPGENIGYPPAPPVAAPPPVPGRGGLQPLLKEQLLRVVVEVELVKLLPKS